MPALPDTAPRPLMPAWLAYGMAALSGVLYGLAFPPTEIRLLAWVSLVPLLIAIPRSSLRRSFALGLVWCVFSTSVVGSCLITAIENYYEQPAWVGWLFLVGVGGSTALPYYGLFGGLHWLQARRFQAALPLLAGASWVTAELLRVKMPPGNPWGISGYSQIDVLPLMQLASLASVHGMSFLVVAVNGAIATLLLPPRSQTRRPAWIGAGATAALLATALAWGQARLTATEPEGPAAHEIAIIQGNVDIGNVWRRDLYGKNLDVYLRLTHEATKESGVETVFWPESAMTFFAADEPLYRASIGHSLHPRDLELLAGGPRKAAGEDGSRAAFHNSTFVMDPRGEIQGHYDKRMLLPFAEYFPLGTGALMRRDFDTVRQFTPGEETPLLPTRAGAAGIVVCNEAFFPEPAAARVARGAEYLVNPANDSWFGDIKYSLQAFDIVRLRAVEQGRYLVRTSTAGPSAVVDPQGRLLVESRPFEQEWIRSRVEGRTVPTPFSRFGDLFAYAAAAAAIVAARAGRKQPA